MEGHVVRIMTKSLRILTFFGLGFFVIVKAERYSGAHGDAMMPVVLCAVFSMFLFLTGILMALEDEEPEDTTS